MIALRAVRSLTLRDCWIGAGFVRNAVWDHLHGYPANLIGKDVDVVWFDPALTNPNIDRAVEERLARLAPGLCWSVKNQARMHLRNGDAPYRSVADAMRFWPEIATAVAVRLTDSDDIEINAPFGLDDLFALRITPTQSFAARKRPVFDERVSAKGWLRRYPKLQLSEGAV